MIDQTGIKFPNCKKGEENGIFFDNIAEIF